MKNRAIGALSACVWTAALLLNGCGGGEPSEAGVIVTGRLMNGGAPLQAPQNIPGGAVSVELVPVGDAPDREPVSATLDAEGRFEVVGAGQGIKPGRYKLTLSQASYLQDPSLQERYSAANSPVEIDAPTEKVGVVHDLGDIELQTSE